MKIVNLQQFRAMPANTVFSKYEPCMLEPLKIKGETWEHDFLVQDIHDSLECSGTQEFIDNLQKAQLDGSSVKMDFHIQGRDGFFDNDQLFAVWEQDDVKALIDRLQECVL